MTFPQEPFPDRPSTVPEPQSRGSRAVFSPRPKNPIIPGLIELLPPSFEEFTTGNLSAITAKLQSEGSGPSGPPPGEKVLSWPDPIEPRSFYLSFRYMNFAQSESLTNCWGIFLSPRDIHACALSARSFGLAPQDATDAALKLLYQWLSYHFLVDRAVLTLEGVEKATRGQNANGALDIWGRHAHSPNELEFLLALFNAHKSATGTHRDFQRWFIKTLTRGYLNYYSYPPRFVDFGKKTINGVDVTVAESVNLTGYLLNSFRGEEIPGLHRLLGNSDRTGTGAVPELELDRGHTVSVPMRYLRA